MDARTNWRVVFAIIGAAVAVVVLAFVHHRNLHATSSPSTRAELTGRAKPTPPAPKGGSCEGKPPPSSITPIQKLEFGLIRRTGFYYVSGVQIERDLLQHRGLWCAAFTDQAGPYFLTTLRDMDKNDWNVDTLFILSSQASDAGLVRLAHKWHATGIDWVSEATAVKWLGGDPYPLPRWRLLMLTWY